MHRRTNESTTHGHITSIKTQVITEIKDSLRVAWNNARKADVLRELAPFEDTYKIEKDTAIANYTRRKNIEIDSEITKKEQEIEEVLKNNIRNAQSKYSGYTSPRERDLLQVEIRNLTYESEIRKNNASQTVKITKQKIINKEIARLEASCRDKISYKKRELEKKYNDQFTRIFESDYKKSFEDQYTAFDPNILRHKILRRHPWLESEHSGTKINIVDEFVLNVIKRFFWECLQDKNRIETSWEGIDLKLHPTLNWSPIPENILNEIIQGYPLSKPDHFQNHRFNALIDFPPTKTTFNRYDIYQISIGIGKLSPVKCKGEIYCAHTIPLGISEIETLSAEECATIQNLFINLTSERNPTWVLLHKTSPGKSDLYLPKDYASLGMNFDLSTLRNFGHITIKEVDISNHIDLNEVHLQPINIWHAALISRVFKYLITSQTVNLSGYRSNIPALLLLEDAIRAAYRGNYNGTIEPSYTNRAPYSNVSLDLLYSDYCNDKKHYDRDHYLEDWKALSNSYNGLSTIASIDSQQIFILKSTELNSHYTLRFTSSIKKHAFYQGIKLSEHHILTRLELDQVNLDVSQSLNHDYSTEYKLVTANLTLLTISTSNPSNNRQYSYLYHCVARNRLLHSAEQGYLNKARTDMRLRRDVWNITGKLIEKILKSRQADITFANELITFNKEWRAYNCPNETRPRNDDGNFIWNFSQIAQMGTEGLKCFFKTLQTIYVDTWDDTYKEYAPKLNCIFDLNGSLAETPDEYITFLAKKINDFGLKKNLSFIKENCTPLFANISLIVPDNFKEDTAAKIVEIFKSLHARRYKFPDEVCQVTIYNLDITNPHHYKLIELLNGLASDDSYKLLIAPVITAWDRESYINDYEIASRKSIYKALQNTVANNQRLSRQIELEHNTQPLQQVLIGKFKPELELKHRLEQHSQTWGGDDVVYPLTAQSPGIQQQLQQQVAQEYQHTAERQQETVKEAEVARQIHQYHGDEGELIHRNNIHAKGIGYWINCLDVHDLSGIKATDKLDKLFSLWVGSDIDGQYVINRIEPLAMRKMMDFAPCFRDGIDWERTPGFRVSLSAVDNAYILTFDERLEKQDLMDQAEKIASEKRDPYARQLKKANQTSEFLGDYEQFSTFRANDATLLQTMWSFLAKEDEDEIRIKNMDEAAIELVFSEFDSKTAQSAVVARHNRQSRTEQPLAFAQQIEFLKEWASTFVINDEEFIDNLFSKITPSHLLSLGQLFNQYDFDETQNGSYYWLKLAEQIYKSFPEHLHIWINRILTPRQDWSEILEQEEVLAQMRCVTCLKDPDLINIFWNLIDAHGQAVGQMRFSEVWYGFFKLAEYCKTNTLIINHDSCIEFLQNMRGQGNFNATNFLYRLNFVLNKVSEKSDSRSIQEYILNNLEKIDWRYNGIYYAFKYANYRYWDENLHLSGLQTLLSVATRTEYAVKWDNIQSSKISNPIEFALRYAASRIEMNFIDFMKLKKLLINKQPGNDLRVGLLDAIDGVNLIPSLRLIMASIAVGVDRIDDLIEPEVIESLQKLQDTKYTRFLSFLSSIILLDSPQISKYTLQVRIQDMPTLLDVLIDNQDLINRLRAQHTYFDIRLLNICGHALHCFASMKLTVAEQTTNLYKLLDAVCRSVVTIEHPLITAYPWVIKDFPDNFDISQLSGNLEREYSYSNNIKVLLRQIKSVNPATSTYYPNYDELNFVTNQIIKANDMEAQRRLVVDKWISQGFRIVDQDARFRPLTSEEIDLIQNSSELNLAEAYKQFNLALYSKLIKFLAVRVNQSVDDQFAPLIKLFTKLDCKKYYNELGQILGLLIDKAAFSADGTQRYYALPQLISWLNVFLDENKFQQRPYPTEFLKALLDDTLKNLRSSILNHKLVHLDENDGSTNSLKEDIIVSTDSKLPYSSQKLLVNLAIQLQPLERIKKNKTLNSIKDNLLRINGDKREYYYEKLLISLAEDESPSKIYHCLDFLSSLSSNLNYISRNSKLQTLHIENQIKLMQMLYYKQITIEKAHELLRLCSSKRYEYIQTIILAEYIPKNYKDNILSIFNTWEESEIAKLANYYTSLPRPSIEQLIALVTNYKSANDLIHEFESEYQALDPLSQDKRYYSVSDEDIENIQRVLKGMKLKGKGFITDAQQKQLLNLLYYTNTFCQSNKLNKLNHKDLITNLYAELRIKNPEPKSKARILAYMREVLLRKTGKWANHTQMIDLLYGALNNVSIVHQLRTGQGKSIITLMRNAYRALNGQIIDIYSSKNSLSSRDHAEFAMVFDAFGIRNSHLTESSDASLYHTKLSDQNIGAVNYITVGNWSLFASGLFWQVRGKFDLKDKNRVVFIDEGDHVLLDEHTQFNFSDNGDNQTIFNYDEWVYREAYDFFINHYDSFAGIFTGTPQVSRNVEIKKLCELLQQKEWYVAPHESRFFKEYILPTIQEPNAVNFQARDQQLRQLFTAAYMAYNLKEKTDFCIMPETRVISDGVGIDTSFAKVVINNQVFHGSTYSDLVQQFLHVRLNYEAVKKGQTPNFFIEPNSEIALSLNAPYIIKNFYAQKEACTGTGGNEEQLKIFSDEFDIDCVIKLPTHEEIRTSFLPPVYAFSTQFKSSILNVIKNGQALQIEQIINKILDYPDNPILITCEDDNAVDALGNAIATELRNAARVIDQDLHDIGHEKNAKFILDTNSSGRSEADVLPFCGRKGSITISSRMGRGTDIRPYDKDIGLFVIRTYPTDPRVEKQERGRQGRNGAAGLCIDILNYNQILAEYTSFRYQQCISQLYESEIEHLNLKLQKHQDKLKKGETHQKWNAIFTNEELKDRYLITRVLQKIKHMVKVEANKYIRKRENVQAIMSGHVLELLPCFEDYLDSFKVEWKKARRNIDTAWNGRLANITTGDSDVVFNKYLIAVNATWQSLCSRFPILNPYLLIGMFNDDEVNAENLTVSTNYATNLRIFNQISARWDEFDSSQGITVSQKEALQTDKKTLKKMLLKYHSDKINPDTLGINVDVGLEFLRDKITPLFTKTSHLAQMEPTSSRVVSHVGSSVRRNVSITPTQSHDMPSVIKFYQFWLDGAANYLFNPEEELNADIVNAIYNDKNVDNFFDIIYFSSAFNRKLKKSSQEPDDGAECKAAEESKSAEESKAAVEYYSRDEQAGRREQLFSGLQVVFEKYPSSYTISLELWAETISFLASCNEERLLENYKAWFEGFFKALSISTPNPSAIKSAEDVIRINKLFILANKIFFNAFEEEASIEFTNNYIEILLGNYKDKFDEYYSYLEKMFAAPNQEEVSKLLQRHTKKADVFRILDMCAEVKEPEALDKRIQAFNSYAASAEYNLDENPKNIRPILETVIYSGNVDYLPKITELQNVSEDYTSKLLEILRDRPHYTQEQFTEFSSIFKGASREQIEILESLPSYLSLHFINNNFRDVPGKHDIGQMQKKLNLIKNNWNKFHEFLASRNVVIGNAEFINPAKPIIFNMWLQMFETMPAEKLMLFINIAKNYSDISDESMIVIVELYCKDKIEHDKNLKKILSTLNNIYQLPEIIIEDMHKYLLDNLNISLSESTKLEKLLNNVDRLVKLLKKYSQKSIEEFTYLIKIIQNCGFAEHILNSLDELLFIYERQNIDMLPNLCEFLSYLQGLDRAKILEILSVNNKLLKKLDAYESKFTKNHKLREFHQSNICNLERSKRLLQLMDIIVSKPHIDNNEIRNMLMDKFLEETIKSDNLEFLIELINDHQLEPEGVIKIIDNFSTSNQNYLYKHAFSVFEDAYKLSINERELNKLFADITQNKTRRIYLMRFIHLGLLDDIDDGSFKNKCIQKQDSLYKSTLKPMVNVKTKHVDFAISLNKWFARIKEIMHEIMDIMQPLVSTAPLSEGSSTRRIFFDISKHKNQYNQYWFTSSRTRVSQADKFFKHTMHNNYDDLFTKILNTQCEIIKTDSEHNKKRWFTNVNRKGYSRLFDITNHVLHEVIQKYMLDLSANDVTNCEHTGIINKMQKHLIFLVDSLKDSLPKTHSLHLAFENILIGTPQEGIEKAVQNALFNNNEPVPKHLLHIEESIKLYLSLCEKSSLMTSPDVNIAKPMVC